MLLLASALKLVALAAFIVLALFGALFFVAARRGWMRNGYFTIPSVILIVLGAFIAFQGVGSGITFALVGKDIAANPILSLAINGLAELVVMIGAVVLVSQAARQNVFAVFRLEGFHETPALAYLLAVPVIISAQFVGDALIALWTRLLQFFPTTYSVLDKYETQNDKAVEGLVTAHGTIEFILILMFVAIIPAFAEETLFRGFAQSNIERSGHHHARWRIALVIASVLFALVHASVYKFPGLLLLGLALGWMAYRTNNLFVGSLGHAVNNGLIVVMLYLKPDITQGTSLVESAQLSAGDAFAALAATLPFFVLLLYLFHRVTEGIEARHNAEREIAWLNSPTPNDPDVADH